MKTTITVNEIVAAQGVHSPFGELLAEELAHVFGGTGSSGTTTDHNVVEQLNAERIEYGAEVTRAGRDLVIHVGNGDFGSAFDAYSRLQTASDKEEATVNRMNEELRGHNQDAQAQRALDAAVDASIQAGVNQSHEPNMTLPNGQPGYNGVLVVQVGNQAGGDYY